MSFTGCSLCMDALNRKINMDVPNNRILQVFIQKVIEKFELVVPHIEVSLSFLEKLLTDPKITVNSSHAINIRRNYFDFVNACTVELLYSESRGETVKAVPILGDITPPYNKKTFDIYTYTLSNLGDIKINLEHILPASYIRQRYQIYRDHRNPNMFEYPIYEQPLVYSLFNLAPSQTKLNAIRKNFLYADVAAPDFVVSNNKLFLQTPECANGNTLDKIFSESEEKSVIQHLPEYTVESNDKNVDVNKLTMEKILLNEPIILKGKFCDQNKYSALCSTCNIEPSDISKGDIARSILMSIVLDWNNLKTADRTNRSKYVNNIIKLLPTYIDWNESFPPTHIELTKNNNLLYMTGLCNPFIEHYVISSVANKLSLYTKVFSKSFIEHVFLGKYPESHIFNLPEIDSIVVSPHLPQNLIFDAQINLHATVIKNDVLQVIRSDSEEYGDMSIKLAVSKLKDSADIHKFEIIRVSNFPELPRTQIKTKFAAIRNSLARSVIVHGPIDSKGMNIQMYREHLMKDYNVNISRRIKPIRQLIERYIFGVSIPQKDTPVAAPQRPPSPKQKFSAHGGSYYYKKYLKYKQKYIELKKSQY